MIRVTCAVGRVVWPPCRAIIRLARSADNGSSCSQPLVAATPTASQCLHDRVHSAVWTWPAGHAACRRHVRHELCADPAAWSTAECESNEGVVDSGWPDLDILTAGRRQLRSSTLQSATLHQTGLWGSLSMVVVLCLWTNLSGIHRQGLHQQAVWKGDQHCIVCNADIKAHFCLALCEDGARKHRRTSWGSCSPPPDPGKTVIFGQKLNFSGRSQQSKMNGSVKWRKRNSFCLAK